MKRMLATLTGLTLLGFGCGSDPGYEATYGGATTRVNLVEDRADLPRANAMASIEAPRKTVIAMQTCAEGYASNSAERSLAVLFELEVNPKDHQNIVRVKDSMLGSNDLERCIVTELERMPVPSEAIQRNVLSQSRSAVGVVQAAAAPVA